MTTYRSSIAWRALALASLAAGAACSDPVRVDGSVPNPDSGRVIQIDRSGDVVVRDAAIDLNDTHLALEVVATVGLTIRSDTLFRDPVSGNMVYEFTFPARAESLQVEAGFDAQGRAHLNSYVLAPIDSELTRAQEVRQTASVDGVHSVLDGNGAQFVPPVPGSQDPRDVVAQVGSASDLPIDAYVLGGGAGGSTGGGGGGGPGDGTTMTLLASVGGANGAHELRRFRDAGDRLHVVSSVPAPQAGGPDATMEMVYVSAGKRVRLAEARTTQRVMLGNRQALLESAVKVRKVQLAYNEAKARARALRRARRDLRLGATSNLSTFNPCIKRVVVGSDSGASPLSIDCGTSGGGPAGFPETPIPVPQCDSTQVARTGSGSRNLMLVHGFTSNGCAWKYLANGIVANGKVRAVSLPWSSSYSFQADRLRQEVAAEGTTTLPFILVGHSQGGMVSRLAAQRGPASIRGVITIGTPNGGAPFARDFWKFGLALGAVSTVLPVRFGPALSSYVGTSVTLLKATACQVGSFWGGSICDGNPDGGTVRGINSTANPPIPGAAVVHHAGNDRLFYRMAGDFACAGCGTNATAAVTGLYRAAMTCTVVNGIFGFFFAPLWQSAWDCSLVWGSIDALDWSWQQSVSGGATSDGFIPVTSQEWPGVSNPDRVFRESQQFRVPRGATHASELRDNRTKNSLNLALDQYFP